MLGPSVHVLWFISLLLEIAVLVCALYRRAFARYLALNLYILCSLILTVGLELCRRGFGIASFTYFLGYYCSNSLLCILKYFVIVQLYRLVFAKTDIGKEIRAAAALLLAATAMFSYVFVQHSQGHHLTARFVVELEQNLNFLGVVLVYLLWGAMLKLRETRTRLIQFCLALGIYFSATAGTYALRNLFPSLEPAVLRCIPLIAETLLSLAWAYTYLMVPEEARLATAPLAFRLPGQSPPRAPQMVNAR